VRLPQATFPGGSWKGSAMSAGERGTVAKGFVPEAKQGKAWKYVKCTGGEGECEKLGLSLDHLFIYLFIYFSYYAFILFRYKKPHAARAMEKTKPIKHKT